MPLNYICRKYIGGYKFIKSQEKINCQMCMVDIQMFVKNEKELKTIIQTIGTYSQENGMEFGTEKSVKLIMEKKEKSKNASNRTTKLGKN